VTTKLNNPTKHLLYDLLSYNPFPAHSLRRSSSSSIPTLKFPHLLRRRNDLDFTQLATSSPVSEVPLYIHVVQSLTNCVMAYDVPVQMFRQLDMLTLWIDDDVLRAEMTRPPERPMHSKEEAGRGVKRVDCLRGRCIFEGLVKGRNGM
jgi:hypothetical protein